ncbi:MAG: hypothetical protein OHK0031_13880 [Anaerolineales bacterium]
MKHTQRIFTLLILLAILLFPWQPAHAWQGGGPNGSVIVGSSYTLKDGETLTDGLVVVGGSATLKSGATLQGDLVVVGGSALIEKGATLTGAVVVVGGGLMLNDAVGGDAVIIGGPADLQANAHIHGNLVTIGGTVTKAQGARVDGDSIDNVTPPAAPALPKPISGGQPEFVFTALKIFLNAVLLSALAALLALFLPAQMRRIAETVIHQPLMTGGMGILTWILFVVAVVALGLFSIFIITLFLTVPLLLVVILVMVAAAVFGWLALGAEVGTRLIALTGREWPLAASAALGTFLLTLVANSVGTIPCVGWVLDAVISLMGLGAVLMTRFGTRPSLVPASPASAGAPAGEIPPAAGE